MQSEKLKQMVTSFLNAHRKAVFAILDEEGLPTTSLMLYAVDDDLNVYFGTRRSFFKYDHLIAHQVVSLSVIEEGLDPKRVVDIRGKVEEIPATEMVETHRLFKSKNPSKYYIEGAEDFVMFRLRPDFMRWLDATSGELSIVDLQI